MVWDRDSCCWEDWEGLKVSGFADGVFRMERGGGTFSASVHFPDLEPLSAMVMLLVV